MGKGKRKAGNEKLGSAPAPGSEEPQTTYQALQQESHDASVPPPDLWPSNTLGEDEEIGGPSSRLVSNCDQQQGETAAVTSPAGLDAEDRRQQGQAEDKERQQQLWMAQKKQFIVLTSAGKPVYSRHGEEDALAGLMALTTAIVSVIQDQGDAIQHLFAGTTLIVFLIKGPLFYVASSRLGESVLVLQRQLEMLHLQIMLVVSSGLERILLRNPSYDARGILEGMGPVLDNLVDYMQGDATHLLPGLQPLGCVPHAVRAAASHILSEAVRSSGAVYGLLLAVGGQVVAVERSKGVPGIDHRDLLLLDNFVCCTPAFRQEHAESFCPLCLPNFDHSGFLHAYIHFFSSRQDGGQGQGHAMHSTQSQATQRDATFEHPAPGHVLQRAGNGQINQFRDHQGEGHSTQGHQGRGPSSQGQQVGGHSMLEHQVGHPVECQGWEGYEAQGRQGVQGGRKPQGSGNLAQGQNHDRQGKVGLQGQGYSKVQTSQGQHASQPCRSRPLYLVLLSPSPIAFSKLSTARVQLEAQLTQSGAMRSIQSAASSPKEGRFSIQSLPKPLGSPAIACSPLFHFMARMPTRRQAFRAALSCHALYDTHAARSALSQCYAHMYALMVEHAEGSRPNKAVWLATEHHILLALADPELELYMVLDPLIDKTSAVRLGEQLRHYLMDKSICAEHLLSAT